MSKLGDNRLLSLARAHRLCIMQIKVKEISENVLDRFCMFISALTVFQYPQTRNHPNPFRPHNLGLGLGSFVSVDLKHECMYKSNQYGPEACTSIEPVSLVGRMLSTNALALNLTWHTQLRDKFASLSLLLAGMHPSLIRRANPDHTQS